MKSLKNLHIVITGAASGIGLELAKDLYHKEACHLILIDKNYNALTKVKKRLFNRDSKQSITLCKCDIGRALEIKKLAAKIKDKKIDILINNAGIFYSGSFESMNIKDFESVLNIDLLGTIRLTKALIPKLLKGQKPCIVNMASLAGLIGAPGMCAYSTAKFGIVGFSQSLQAEFNNRIDVSIICPSFVKTKMAAHAIYPQKNKTKRDKMALQASRFLSKIGSDPKKVSQEIIRAIKNNKKLVLINPDAYFFYYLNKFLPETCSYLVVNLYKRLLKRGVISL